MSTFIKSMEITDNLIEQTFRAIAVEYRHALEMYNVQIDSRAEYAFGNEVKRILTMYDEGRIRESQMWRKMATEAAMQLPGKPFIIGGPWHGADPTLVKCNTCGSTHPTGTVTDHAYWPVEK